MKLVFATNNRGKLQELRALLESTAIDSGSVESRAAASFIEAVGLGELGLDVDVVEDRDTFAGNARKKAEEIAALTGLPALGDDSGLEVDALGGAPGVYSARFGGLPSGAVDAAAANNARLLRDLALIPAPRTARFRCVLALARPRAATLFTDGTLDGEIGCAPRGEGGFGYDPLFIVPALGRTLAQLTLDEKNRISHRGVALRAMVAALRRLPPDT